MARYSLVMNPSFKQNNHLRDSTYESSEDTCTEGDVPIEGSKRKDPE